MAKLRTIGPTCRTLDMRTCRPAPKQAEAFYTSREWRDLVASLIVKRGRRCECCGKTQEDDGSPVKLIGDHIVERKDGGADLDPANVQLLCWPCHNAKTAKSRRERYSR